MLHGVEASSCQSLVKLAQALNRGDPAATSAMRRPCTSESKGSTAHGERCRGVRVSALASDREKAKCKR